MSADTTPASADAVPSFETISLAALDSLDEAGVDALPFGVVGLSGAGDVEVYNAAEARIAGLSKDNVLGQHFFESVAPCMNNYLVAQRFEDEASLDDAIDYVLTVRMRPTSVKLRLLKSPQFDRRYLLVKK